jgi:hypothetical protein
VDDADRAQDYIEENLRRALAKRAPTGGLVPAGACHYCGEPVGTERLFCDSECEGEWQHERRMRAMAGR